MTSTKGDPNMDMMKDKIRSQCERAIELNQQSLASGSLDVKRVITPILASISHGRGWKIRIELEKEFKILD